MRGFRSWRLLVGLTLGLGTATAQVIPPVHGATFSGSPVDLPADLRGKVGVLVIGFSQGSRGDVTVWGKRLAEDYYDSPAVLYYEMPVLASVPKLMRGFVTGRIKAEVSDRGKTHFLPLDDHEPEWRTLTHYAVPDDAYVLLVDSSGVIRWQEHGPATDAAYAALRQQVEALRGAGSGPR
jgi:hypothetical protein